MTPHESLKAIGQVAPQSVAAAGTAVSASAVDISGFEEILAVLNIGAYTGGVTSVTVEVEDSADGSSYAAVTGASSTTTLTTASKVHVGRVRRSRLRQYARMKITVNGGTSAIVGGTLFGASPRNQPVTQDNALAFNLT